MALSQPRLTDEITLVGTGFGGPEEDWREQRGRVPTWVKIALLRLLVVVAFLIFWQLASGTLIRPFFISSPLAIAERLVRWVTTNYIFFHIWITVQEMIAGLALGALVGIALGFLFGRNEAIASVFSPFIAAIYSIPKLALAPLFILWFGIGLESKIVYTAIVVFFLVFYNTYAGVRDVNPLFVNVVTLMGASRRQVLTKVVLPSASAWIFAGLKLAVPYALVGAVVAELLSSNKGLGSILSQAQATLDTTSMFAGLICLMVIALLVNEVVDRLERHALRWKHISK
ncbi:MAG: ABC transporter permease [Dehalococcoidia bacterium]|nr:MAG: ABC transporter permease [Dehalococcoidia bacterium]